MLVEGRIEYDIGAEVDEDDAGDDVGISSLARVAKEGTAIELLPCCCRILICCRSITKFNTKKC